MADTLEDHAGGPEPMAKTRKSVDEQLEALRQKKQAIEKQLGAVEKRKKSDDRKLDTRRKIIAGGAVIAHAQIDPEFRRAMQTALQKAVAPKDRPLVADLLGMGLPANLRPSPSSGTGDGGQAARNQSAPAVPPRPTRPDPQSPGKGPSAP